MENLVLLIVCCVLTVLSALLTTYIAQERSFWRWFLLGLVLPFVSIFVAMVVVYRDTKKEEEQAKR
ncbi:hypothetical protein LJ737_20295 [Hymenobacter sp. 15J16-1T3B]|uniref:hypothetical protein n=1 Tax=Hymenobacter sp. 15J16-1T3B TaxID=2886941 RepID=UPI001D126C48|nr:hypothetical protein [Hymenobacter sp. 15J16-1T3B]MCC3159593.1 hypothetical protein [Hymenobacter sp. 15J16-1T3B]